MNQAFFWLCSQGLLLLLIAFQAAFAASADPRVQILSPKDGSRISQDQKIVLVSGKVGNQAARFPNVDIAFIVDISGSTGAFAGVDLGDAGQLPDSGGSSRFPTPQISIGGISVGGSPPMRNLRNSVLAAEVAAARRVLLQLNPETTRVGVISFGQEARLMQPLTHDFDLVRRALDDILRNGPNGGTNMVEGIRTGISELMGFGRSEKRADGIKVQFLLTDGFPTLPIGGGKNADPEDTNLAINAARLAGKAGIKVHVFALGEEALSYPRAATSIAAESGGTYTPVSRPADVLAVIENISVVGVEHVQIVNLTSGQKASQTRLGADGFFSSAVPVIDGRNQIEVFARASDGSIGRDRIIIDYQSGTQKSLDLEVFLEKEKSLKVQVERLGKSPAEIQRDVERNRGAAPQRPQQMPPASETPR